MNEKEQNPAGQPLEDRALKEAALLFGKELLPLLGVKGNVLRIAPTEQVQLQPMDLLEDFNYEMEDGSWIHLEFESDRITVEDLRRFRTYESVMSYHYQVEVTTYVICSSNVRKLREELTEGWNTYRVKVIRLKDQNADQIIPMLEQRRRKGGLKRGDLLRLLLTPLMGGSMSQKERIRRGMAMLCGEQEYRAHDELVRMESVLYTLAMKFLTVEELRDIREMMNMTILGEMILNDGIERGMKQGVLAGRADSVLDLLEDTGSIPQELTDAIRREPDMERLRRWHRLAARVGSVEEFQRKYLDL